MSLVAISGNASGTGTLTIAAPNTNSNYTLTLPTATTELVGTDATQTLTNKTLTTPNIDSAQVATVSGTASLYMARAWVNFNGTGTVAIRASGNVTSITDNGAGDYTFFGSSGQTAAATIPAMLGINRDNLVYSTTAIRLYNLTGAGALPDSAYLNVCIFR
jgi:hypothetical protein